jgi:sucrose-6-phosphate hydrolase SacC (GH32 family)
MACWLAPAACLCLAGCGRYGDFTLPPEAGGDSELSWVLDQRPDPVLARGRFRDVLNPSVVRGAPGYLNFYSAFDGLTWHTALAESPDGLVWRERGIILSPSPRTWEGTYIAANGSALLYGGRFWYWYQAGPRDAPRIGLARSGDAGQWRKEPAPVLEPGPYGSWDECGVADPYVIRVGGYFYLYYLGQDRARPTRQRIGVARSTDGLRWEKLRSNPVLELDGEAGLGEPAVWTSDGFYWMLYTARDFAENRRLGLARSIDGVHWRKLPAAFAGASAWNSKVLCDATVLVEGGDIRVWFGGGDVASPDENLHGQIGAGRLVH